MTIALRSAAALTAALFAVPAVAQTPAAPAAPRPASPAVGGPVIAGLCIYDQNAVIGGSTVGRFVIQRLQQLETEVENELRTERNAIETEARALQTGRATIAPQQFETRATAVQTRSDAFQRRSQLRGRELQATSQKALQRVGTELDPLVRQAYTAKNCGVLLSREAVVLANPQHDLSPQVVTALNGRLTTFTINRERLPETPAPAAAGAARPAPTTPAAQTPPTTRR